MKEKPTPLPMPRIARYQQWLEREKGLHFDSYEALWHWSTTELSALW